MQIKLWKNFSKRRNSTKIPADENAAIVNVNLKENSSIENPTFLLTTVDFEYNYAYAFGHYYFISDITLITKDVYEIRCEQDILATYKTDIQSTKAHILYSSSNYDLSIIDNRIATSTKIEFGKSVFNIPFLSSTGCFILTIANPRTGANGFSASYVCNSTIIQNLALYLYNTTDIWTNLEKQFQSVYGCIISCTWLPLDYNTIIEGLPVVDVAFGDNTSTIQAHLVVSGKEIKGITGNMSIPWNYTDFRNSPPYTTVSLLIPGYGMMDINAGDIIEQEVLGFYYSVDICSGDTIVGLLAQSGVIIQTINFNIGVQCPIAQTSTNMQSVLTSSAGAVGGLIAAGFGFASGAGAVAIGASLLGASASATNAVLNYNTHGISVKGSIQGRTQLVLGTQLQLYVRSVITEEINEDYISKQGLPVMKVDLISNHSGYVQCNNASINIDGLSGDKDALNSFLNGGFYLE